MKGYLDKMRRTLSLCPTTVSKRMMVVLVNDSCQPIQDTGLREKLNVQGLFKEIDG